MVARLQTGDWGLLAGSALVVGAVAGYLARVPRKVIASVMAFGAGVLLSILAMIADTMIPKAFENAHLLIGLITVVGFPVASGLSQTE
jgi:zinc transporter, ZIP family